MATDADIVIPIPVCEAAARLLMATPLSKEEETVTSKKTLSERHGDVECQSHSDSKRAEESSPVQLDDLQIEDVHKQNLEESFHLSPENIQDSVKAPPEEQSINVTPHGDTIKAIVFATINADDKESNIQVTITDNKSVDEKPTEEDISCILTNEVSKEGESDLNQMIAEQEDLENNTSGETIKTLETSTSDELQISDEPVTTSVDYGVPSDNTSSESHADVECQYKTLEDAATSHSDIKVTEKSKEISFAPVEHSQIDHNEHLEEESERLPLTEASTWGTNVSKDTCEAKQQDEDHKEATLSESEQSTKCTLVTEGVQIENTAESLNVPLENIRVSNISQENNIEFLPDEQSTNAHLHGNKISAKEATIDAAEGQKNGRECFLPIVSGSPKEEVTSNYRDETIIDEVDKHEEVSENLSTTVSTEDAEGNSLVELEGSTTKKEDDSKKESDETLLPLPLALEVSEASTFLHEARVEDGEPKKAEFCADEMDAESLPPKTESTTEGDVHVDSEETKVPDSVGKISEGGTVDAEAEKEENVENVPIIIPNEKTEENLCIHVDGQETENEQLSWINDYPANASNDEVIVKDEEPSGEELFEKDKNTESVSLTEEVESKKAAESLHAALEDIKTSDFDQCTEATGILEEQIPIENSPGMSRDETGIDAANTNEKTQELQNVSNEDSDKDLLIKVADSETTHDINLEEELETPPLTETSKDEASDHESILLEPKTSNDFASKVELLNDEKSTDCTTPKKESLQPQDHKTPTSSTARETTCSLEEQNLGENSETIISDKLIDASAAEKYDLTLENVATETPHEHIEENVVTQVDSSVGKHEERMEEDNQSSSLIEAPAEETDVMESKNIDERKNCEESIKPDLENGENTKSIIHVKEESDVETPIDSLQVKPDDVKQHDSVSDINESIEEEISNPDPQEISTNKVERKSVDATQANEENVETKDVAKEIPDCDKEDKIPIEEVGSQNPLNEALAGNANDDESTKITEDCLITKEEPLESLQVADQDIETPPSSKDREIGSLDEESPTTNIEAITDNNKEEIPNNTTGEEDETPKDKDIVENIVEYGKEDNMPYEEVGLQNPLNGASSENANIEESPKINECSLIKEEASPESLQEADQDIETSTEGSLIREEVSLESLQEVAQGIETTHLGQEREISSPNEQRPLEGIKDDNTEEIADSETSLEVKTNHEITNDLDFQQNIANTTPHEDKKESTQVQEDCSQQEQNESKNIPFSGSPAVSCTVSSPVKEEERVKTPTEKKILSANPQGTCDETHENTVNAANINNNYAATPDEDTKEDSRDQVDNLVLEQEEHSEKDSESTSLSDAPKDEITESTLVKEVAEVEDPIDSSEVATEDIKAFAPCQVTEISSTVDQIIDTKDISSNKITEKTVDASDEDTQEAQDIAKSVPREYGTPNEQNTEAILIKEDVSIGLPRIVGDETSSVQEEDKVEIPTEEQTLTDTPQGICDKTEEITVDAANNNNDLVISFPNGDSEDDSPIEVDGLQEPFSKEVPAEKSNDDEPTTSHEVEFANENTVKANLNENEEKLECSLVKEEAHVESLQVADKDVKDTSSGQDRKPSHLEEQGSTKYSHETMGDERYAKSFDSTDLKQETLADENHAATTDEDTKEDSRNHVDYLLMEQEEHSVKDSVSTSISDAPKDDIRGSTLATEVAEVEDPIDSSQVATEDIKAFAPSQDTKTSSTVEQITDSKDISSNKIMEKTVDATSEESQEAQDIAKSVPREDDSPNKQNTEATLMKEDQSIELPQIVAEDIKEPCSSEIREANAQEEQIPCASSGVLINDNKEKTTIDPTIFKNETLNNEVPEVSEEAVEKAPEEVKEKIFTNEAIERILYQEEPETSIEEPATKIDCENPHNLDIACVETDTQDSSKEVVQTTIIPEGENEEHNKEDEICSSDELQVKEEEHLILSEGKSKEEANKTYKEACVEAEQFDLSSQTKDISECAISDVGQETQEENENYAAEKSYEEDDPKQITECEVSSASEDIKLTEQSSEDASITAEVLEAKAGTDLGAAVPVPEATGIESQEVEELNDKCTEMADTSTPNETSVVTASKNIGESAEGAPLETEDQPTKDIALTEQLSEGAFITAEVQEEKDGIYLGAAVPVPEATGSECQEVEELNDKCTKMADTSATVENSEISTLNSIGESTERAEVEAKNQQAKLRDFLEESNMRHTEVKMAGIDDAVNLQSVGDTGEDVQDQEFCKESFGVSNNQNPVKGDPEERSETSEGKEANPIQAAPASESLEQEIEEQKPGRDTEDVHEEDTNISNIPNQLESVCGADTAKLPESSNYQSSVENTDQCDRSVNCSQQEQNESESIPSLEAPAVSCTESSPVKEEEKVEIPTGEQILTANPQGNDETREKTVDAANENNNVVISIPNGDNEDNSPIKVDGLQEHFPEEVPAEKINDDEPTTVHGVEFANENAVKANLNENEQKPECSHVNEEVYTESMQAADEDVTDTSSGQDRKSRHLEEQASTEYSHETIGDEGYARTFDSTDLKQETLEDENYAANPDEETKEDTRDQVGGLLLEQEEHSETESESTSLSDGPKVDITESTLVKEVAEVEDAIDTAQEATEDIKVFDPCQDIEISSTVEQITDSKDISSNKITEKTVDATSEESQEAQDIAKSVPREYDSPHEQNTEAILIKEKESIELPRIVAEGRIPVQEEEKMEIPTEEQILTVNPQGTCDDTQEIAVDAANKDNDVVISVPNGDNEDNSPIEVGGLQEPFSEEVPAEKINDAEPTTTHEVEFANESIVKVNLNENEEKLECPHVNEEVYIESLQVVDEDVKDTSSSQDRKPSHLEEQASTKDSHETKGDERYAKSFDSTDQEQETLEDEARIIVNYAPTTDEDTKEDSRSQVDDLLMEQEEHSVKDSESTSVSYAPKDNIAESTLVKEVAEVDDPIGTEIVTGDIKAFSPCQDTELCSTVEKIIDSKDILSNKITEKTADATGEETQEAQDIAKSVTREDDSPNEQDTEATLMKEELSIESCRIAAEDIEPGSSKIRETNSREEQLPCASPGQVINDNEEKKTTDPTIFENEIPKNEERSLNLTAEETTPCTEDMNVNKVIIGHIPEVTDDKQQDSPVMKVPEENIMQSNENVLDGNSMGSGVSEKIRDQVDGEANSCGDKTDLEKIEVLNDGPLAVPTSETLAEIESRGCTETEVQVPKGEKEAEFKREAENDQKNIDTTLPDYAASENVSELKEVNGEEEIASNNCAEILSSPISVASEEVSTSNVALEEDSTYNTVTHLDVQEASAIKETTPSSAGQHAESICVEENYVCSSTKEESDSNEVAFIPGENKSGLESSNTGLESISQGQHCDIISKTEEEDLKAEAELQSDKAVTEEILQEETTSKKETMKEDISREKEQLPRIKEEHEDIKDYHQGSYEVEVIKESHKEDDVMKDQNINSKETYDFTKHGNNAETVPEVSEEADEKASEDVKEKIFAKEKIERILHQEEQETSIEEPTAKIDISCVNTGTQELNKEVVQTTIIPEEESEEHNKEDELCSSDEVQEHLILSEGKSKEEAKEACVEAEQFDLSSQTKEISEYAISDVGQETLEENEKYTTEKFYEEDGPRKITECEVSSTSKDIKSTERSSDDASITAAVQEAKAGIDLGAAVPVPEATGIESQEVEELNDKCTEMTDASTPDETSIMTASKTIGECTEGAPLEAKDQQTKDTGLTEQLSEGACITAEVHEAKDRIYLGAAVPVPEATGSEERTETSDGKEANPIQPAPVSETLEQEIEEQKLGRDTVGIHEEETNTSNVPNQLESICVADTEKVPESSIHQSSAENTGQCDKKEGNQQIDSPLVLPHAQCSDIKTSENEPQYVGGLASADVTELEASPLSLKDKHVALEADDIRYLILENQDGDKNISTEYSQGEHEVERPSKVEKEREECRNEERNDQQIEGKPESEETDKPSLSDLLQVSMKGTSEMADHSPTEHEPTCHTEDMRAENTGEVEHENIKTDEEKDDEDEPREPKSDLGSEAPVMVDTGDTDLKVAHKKSHNILSGVGSKVKHSIAKVKKAITGKSPKKSDNSRK
ncbi:uncharacterized protein LOC121805448 isoform X2 [Salvia splendens]|uniref:uncharacterized protein LOC121805448 isoform X2 n=1 Tax=Salvia splendens TaxID=180675 RepID=UPI001C263E5A|nr:uncharacterized protein LOC121805448 isoform X2 [Salvia splendens]